MSLKKYAGLSLFKCRELSTGIKYAVNHCTEVECLSAFRQYFRQIFFFLSQGKRHDYRSLGWPSPDECLKLRRVELTTVASTWLAVSAKNIE